MEQQPNHFLNYIQEKDPATFCTIISSADPKLLIAYNQAFLLGKESVQSALLVAMMKFADQSGANFTAQKYNAIPPYPDVLDEFSKELQRIIGVTLPDANSIQSPS